MEPSTTPEAAGGYVFWGTLVSEDLRGLLERCASLRFTGLLELEEGPRQTTVPFIAGQPAPSVDLFRLGAVWRHGSYRLVQRVADLEGHLTPGVVLAGSLGETSPLSLLGLCEDRQLSADLQLESADGQRARVRLRDGQMESVALDGQPDAPALATLGGWSAGQYRLTLAPLFEGAVPPSPSQVPPAPVPRPVSLQSRPPVSPSLAPAPMPPWPSPIEGGEPSGPVAAAGAPIAVVEEAGRSPFVPPSLPSSPSSPSSRPSSRPSRPSSRPSRPPREGNDDSGRDYVAARGPDERMTPPAVMAVEPAGRAPATVEPDDRGFAAAAAAEDGGASAEAPWDPLDATTPVAVDAVAPAAGAAATAQSRPAVRTAAPQGVGRLIAAGAVGAFSIGLIWILWPRGAPRPPPALATATAVPPPGAPHPLLRTGPPLAPRPGPAAGAAVAPPAGSKAGPAAVAAAAPRLPVPPSSPAAVAADNARRLIVAARKATIEGRGPDAMRLFRDAFKLNPSDPAYDVYVPMALGKTGQGRVTLDGPGAVTIDGHLFRPPRRLTLAAGPHTVEIAGRVEELVVVKGAALHLSATSGPLAGVGAPGAAGAAPESRLPPHPRRPGR